VVDTVLTTVMAGGHLLLEDVPGVGKTTLAAALAQAVGGAFRRLQFTADMLPGDVTGVMVLRPEKSELEFRAGPVFTNVLLADEINRTTPRTQSALLEAMGEGSVTVDGQTRELPDPFFVVATQNPYEFHGTYPLPEAQLDRFLVRISLGYPSREDERAIMRQHRGKAPTIQAVTDPSTLAAAVNAVEAVRVAPSIEDYVLDLVWATRSDRRVARGASPRGAQALFRACRARAVVKDRDFVIPEDIRAMAAPVLGHRILARAAADSGTRLVQTLLDELPPPS
jgi:MoxR-like ATPase